MKKAQAGLIGVVMMIAGIALVLGVGAAVLAGVLITLDPGTSASTASVVTPPPAAVPAPATEPAAHDGSGNGAKLALGVVADDATPDKGGDGAADADGDEKDAEDAGRETHDAAAHEAETKAAEPEEKVAEPEEKAAEPKVTSAPAAPTEVGSITATPSTKTAPAPRKAAPTAVKPASSGPASIVWSGKKPMVYTFTGADGTSYSGSRARLPAGTYTFAAAVSGLAPEKQPNVVVAKGASSITIHCDEGSKKCTQK